MLSAHINTNAFLSAIHLIIGSVAHALYSYRGFHAAHAVLTS